ncbi:Zinc finger CCCH domain-containing protein 32 [Camellia lanceoleosa]|uniref:Zinc finger CCCH domain-containing protein 32 n=1 Tax=Camellia lanceoleosa TaxID=1840588 RepID=A0ACC0F3U2_9ERIC|nr:Zinc finger CCCH domain-containing protein 32 [Camellia lanceoleosa]
MGSGGAQTGIEESVRRLGFWNSEILYPERPGEPDCAYFMRNGTCGYGIKCRYNHPRDRSSVGVAVRIGGGEFPERPGEPACQFYLRTGTCKFGVSCKFHHPRNGGGSISNVPPNSYGFPLRPIIVLPFLIPSSCTMHCMVIGRDAEVPTCVSIATGYRTGRPPLLPGSYVPGAYGPVLLPPGVVPIMGWSPYSGPISPVLSPSAPPMVGTSSLYGVPQLSSSAAAFSVPYSPLLSTGDPSSGSQKERVFPERPGQPECQYYLKTGDCKFGSSCRFHHPPDWVLSKANYLLSLLGLPLRPIVYYGFVFVQVFYGYSTLHVCTHIGKAGIDIGNS